MMSELQLNLKLVQPAADSEAGNTVEPKSDDCSPLMARVLDRNNLDRAYHQVKRNKGAPGVDGMSVGALLDFVKEYWPVIRSQLRQGTYHPKPVKRVEIPKPDGRKRKLGIPTVLDRLIQQAISQVLQEEWDGDFHDHSYGFRPNRNAHQAIKYAQATIKEGYTWVVDCDLDSFFDEVNHDLLMTKLKRKHQDPIFLKLINRFLKAGILIEGQTQASTKGVPQGGPLSPILSNIVLNQLDWELDQRALRFVRYADDAMVFVKSRQAGARVMTNLQHFVSDSLRLKVNVHKSAVDRPWKRTFLGITFSRRDFRIKVSDKSLSKLKDKVRELSRRTRGHSLNQIVLELRKSLLAYFDVSEVLSPLRDLDKWIRRRLRCYIWKQWGRSGYRQLRKRGVDRQLAWNTAKSAHGPWRLSASPALYYALPNRYFSDLGLPALVAR